MFDLGVCRSVKGKESSFHERRLNLSAFSFPELLYTCLLEEDIVMYSPISKDFVAVLPEFINLQSY